VAVKANINSRGGENRKSGRTSPALIIGALLRWR
jgi:hypothetical protein